MSEKRSISRREFLRVAAVMASGAAVAACQPQTVVVEKEVPVTQIVKETVKETVVVEGTPRVIEKEVTKIVEKEVTRAPEPVGRFTESPTLIARVEAGELPPVEERLPKDPKIANEMDVPLETGKHGGTIRRHRWVPDWDAPTFCMVNEPLINTPGIKAEVITPNILKDYSVSDDYKEFTFSMREGLRWSDGEPVTTRDVSFAWEDCLMNEALTTSMPTWLRGGNNPDNDPLSLEIIDDFTFKMTSPTPYGGFLVVLAIQGWRSYTDLLVPAHHLEQFHADYAEKSALDKMVSDEGLEDWTQLFGRKKILNFGFTGEASMDFPKLSPWILIETSPEMYTYDRNVYYFKTDSQGNQLPYVDDVVSYLVADAETAALKEIAGEVDFEQGTTSLAKMALYKENEEKGGYNTYVAARHITPTDVHLNLTYDDPVWREVVRDPRFRKALTAAIDVDEVIDAVYFGFAEPSTIIPTGYDPDKANRLLDEMGLDKRDSEDFRLGPDGKTFVIPFEVFARSTDIVPVTELVTQFWLSVGVKTTMKQIDSALWGQRNAANELQATVSLVTTPLWYYGDWGQGLWAPLWRLWYTSKGESGEEPPEDVLAFYRLIDSVSTGLPEEGKAAVERIKHIMYEKVYFITHLQNVMAPIIASKSLANIDNGGFGIAWNFAAEQFFYRD